MKSMIPALLGTSFLLFSCNKIDKTDPSIDFPAAFVINGESNSISIINRTEAVVAQTCEFKKGSWPHHIYASQSGDQLVVSLVGADLSGGHAHHGGTSTEGDSYLMVLDASTFKILACTKAESASHNAIFMNDDSEIWAAEMSDDGDIVIYDSKSFREKERIELNKSSLEITKDMSETYAFVANGSGKSITVIKIDDKSIVKTLGTGDEPVGAWPAANQKMYVDCEVSKEIYEIDVATLSITDTIPLAFTPAYVAYDSLHQNLWVSDTDNGGIRKYILTGSDWIEAAYLPTAAGAHAIGFDETYSIAYVTNQEAGTVSLINTASFTKIVDLVVGKKPNGICILP